MTLGKVLNLSEPLSSLPKDADGINTHFTGFCEDPVRGCMGCTWARPASSPLALQRLRPRAAPAVLLEFLPAAQPPGSGAGRCRGAAAEVPPSAA